MNKEVLETQWTQIREILRDKFSNLTDDDIRQINGRYDQLVAKLQQKYGYSREEAEDRIRSWNFDRFATANTGRTVRDDDRIRRDDDRLARDDSSSLLKWILGLGIPLLLALYLFSQLGPNHETTTTTTTNTTGTTQVYGTDDRALATNIRDAILSNRTFANDVRNVQFSANNGVVTVSGTVPDADTHDFVIDSAKKFNGVRQVIDHLEVR